MLVRREPRASSTVVRFAAVLAERVAVPGCRRPAALRPETSAVRAWDGGSARQRAGACAAPARMGACHRGVVRVDVRLTQKRVVDRDFADCARKP